MLSINLQFGRAGLLPGPSWQRSLVSALLLISINLLRGAEPWADDQLPVRDGLELWFDASRQISARDAEQLPPLGAASPVDYLFDGSGNRQHLAQRLADFRPRFLQQAGVAFLRFDGKDDFLARSHLRRGLTNATLFLMAAPRSNAGGFRGFLAWNRAGQNDYTTGFNLDLGPAATPRLSVLNAEGAGSVGAINLLPNRVFDFGRWHSLVVATQPGAGGTQLFIDGQPQGQRDRGALEMRMDELTLGARCYSNSAEPPFAQGFLEGDIAELLVFNRTLTGPERSLVEKYLAQKYAALLALPPISPADGSVPLVTVTNPPPVQMLLPGFSVRELPVELDNLNNVKYRPDGKLVALGYNGHVYLLSDTDEDGLEDKVETFWERDTLRGPIGMALTPAGYARGQGVFIAAKGKVALLVDTNGDDRADREIEVATWKEHGEQQGVDSLGVALDSAGNLYFSLGAASYTGAYLIDPGTGRSRYRLESERGTILKVSPDFQRREIVCTGIRFAVALAFNRAGDLFCTDQEGATWLPNGNPLDELLHIQPGRHYGFPPRHPKYLPNVVDEPSVYDYAPQHESTCGLNFNDPVNGGPTFGPASWSGNAFVAGYSRGKLYRTQLVKTAAGYVAKNQLLASCNSLVVDACLSPRGDLMVATHGGKPDWGSGPNGKGHLYRLRHEAKAGPQPVLAWSASPTELRVAFDRALDPTRLKNLVRQTSITQGQHVFAGDRFETIRPGYQVVQDQLAAPRFAVPIFSAGLSADQRTLRFTTPARSAGVNYALTLPSTFTATESAKRDPANIVSHPEMDLLSDLTGVEARWESSDRSATWQGWLPHPNMAVARAFTAGSAEQEDLWRFTQQPGTLTLRGQLDLWQMLQPAVQPGSKLDYERPTEEVTVVFSAATPFTVARERKPRPDPDHSPGARESEQEQTPKLSSSKGDDHRERVILKATGRQDDWLPFAAALSTGRGELDLDVTWFTADDPRPRAFPLRRIFLPWASPRAEPSPATADRMIPELAGGRWLPGKKAFFSETVGCAKCHRIRGEGSQLGPDLSNLIHRDYASVLKDIREPNAAINPDHIAYNLELKNGEALTGVLRADSGDQLTLADASGHIVAIPKANVRSVTASTLSLMPEGLDKAMSSEQLRDLMTFLLTSPLDPAALEIKNEPPPRSRAEIQTVGNTVEEADRGKAPFRVVLCAGPKDHGPGEHDYPLWQKRWAALLALAENVTIETAQEWPSPAQRNQADVIAFYSDNPGWNAERAKALDAFLERGGGAVFIHWAVDGHQHVEALASRIGLAWRGGASKFRHGPLDLTFHPHPLAQGFAALHLVDESYWNLAGDPGEITLLASGVEEGELRPLFWTREQGKGRVFVSIPGHYTWTFDDPLFRLLLLRGICWAGGQPMDRLSDLSTVGARLGD